MSPTPSKYPAQVPSAVQEECPDQHHNLPWQPSSGWQETPSPWFHWQIPGVVHLTATYTPLSTNHQFGYRILGFYCAICSEVHVVWAGSQPVCSRSCKYFLPVLPCLVALPVALPIGNCVTLPQVFPLLLQSSNPPCPQVRAHFPGLPCMVVFWLSSQVSLWSALVGTVRYGPPCLPATGRPFGPCWASYLSHTQTPSPRSLQGPVIHEASQLWHMLWYLSGGQVSLLASH